MRLLYCLIIFSGSYFLPALSSAEVTTADKRLTPVKEISEQERLLHFNEAVAATLKFSVLGNGSGAGTAVAISNDGYYLTVRHAIEAGLRAFHVKKFKTTNISINEFDRTAIGHDVYFRLNPQSEEIVTAKLIAAGPADIIKDAEILKDPNTVDELRKMGWSDVSDFAILKFPAALARPCVRGSDQKLRGGDAIWSLQYPGPTMRADHNSDGSSLYYTSGTVIPNLSENHCFNEILKGYTPDQWTIVDWVLNGSGAPFTTIDASPGSSGSPVFDKSGLLTGIVTEIYNGGKNAYKEFCPATRIIPLYLIKDMVKKNFSEAVAAEAFNCK